MSLKGKPRYNINYKKVEALYDPALSDEKNAVIIGISQASVSIWRKANGIVAKRATKPEKIKEADFYRCYNAGYTDKQIAEALEVSLATVTSYRKVHGIPSKYPRCQISIPKHYVPVKEERFWNDTESMYHDKEFCKTFVKDGFEGVV